MPCLDLPLIFSRTGGRCWKALFASELSPVARGFWVESQLSRLWLGHIQIRKILHALGAPLGE